MPYESQTREQILEAEVELLRFRLNELLGTELVCPIPALNGAKFRIVNLLAKRSPMTVAYTALYYATTENPEDLLNPTNTTKAHVCVARRVLGKHDISIETVWGQGYRMPPESAEAWQALVEAANPTPHNLEDAAA